MYNDNYYKVIKVCEYFFCHSNKDVRCNVLTSITPIVLRFGKINKKLVRKVIANALLDPDLEVRAIAEDLIEELEVNLRNYKFF